MSTQKVVLFLFLVELTSLFGRSIEVVLHFKKAKIRKG